MDSLTPHKMFRRAFLAEHDLTFPEGRRRLEDHVFVVSAYLHARTISVLSDYPCYFHTARDDGGNAGFRPLEPVGYFANLRDALDAVDALTEPGAAARPAAPALAAGRDGGTAAGPDAAEGGPGLPGRAAARRSAR